MINTQTADDRAPEINLPENVEVLRLSDGRVVRRTTMNTGNVVETLVFPGSYEAVPGAKTNKAGEMPMRPRS